MQTSGRKTQSVTILLSPPSRLGPRSLHAPKFLGLPTRLFRAFPISDARKPTCRELERMDRFIELSEFPQSQPEVVLGHRPVRGEVHLGPHPQRRLVAGDGAAEVFVAISSSCVAQDSTKNELASCEFMVIAGAAQGFDRL